MFHALDRRTIQPVTVRDEKHGAIMAHGYAKATGRPGVCTATTGPGATNLVTGLFEALKSSVPVIAIVQETPRRLVGKHAASEIDQAAALAPVSKWIGRIVTADSAAEVMRAAFRIATSGRPGPAVVLCPADVMGQTAEAEVYAEPGCDRFPSFRSGRVASRSPPRGAAGGGAAARHRRGWRRDLVQAWTQVVERPRRMHSGRHHHDGAGNHRRCASAERGGPRQLDGGRHASARSPTACWARPTSLDRRLTDGANRHVRLDAAAPGTRVIHSMSIPWRRAGTSAPTWR